MPADTPNGITSSTTNANTATSVRRRERRLILASIYPSSHTHKIILPGLLSDRHPISAWCVYTANSICISLLPCRVIYVCIGRWDFFLSEIIRIKVRQTESGREMMMWEERQRFFSRTYIHIAKKIIIQWDEFFFVCTCERKKNVLNLYVITKKDICYFCNRYWYWWQNQYRCKNYFRKKGHIIPELLMKNPYNHNHTVFFTLMPINYFRAISIYKSDVCTK